MKYFGFRSSQVAIAVTALIVLAACSSAPYRYQPSGQAAIEQRATYEQRGEIEVRAAVPSDDEAKALFGIPLEKRGIQAVWLEITNNGDEHARFAPYSMDRTYFPPYEVAYMYRKSFSKAALGEMEERLNELSIPRHIAAGETVSGYVFTHTTPGTKAFNVDVFYYGGDADNEHFTFFIDVPGFVPDHAEVDFRGLYAEDEIAELDSAGFRSLLAEWPCCTTASDKITQGQPVIVLFVAEGRDLLQALLRAGWSETSSKKTDNYLNNIDYYFGRPPDAIFKKGRSHKRDRNEMSLWLAPVLVDGKPVWAAQVKHAIGRLFDIGEYFFGVRLDPDADEGRNYLLQNIWYSRSLEAFAWSRTGKSVSQESPEFDFNDNVWFSDGVRLVLWLSGDAVSMKIARDIGWDTVARREPKK